MRSLTVRIAESARWPMACACCCSGSADVLNAEIGHCFCRTCDEMIASGEIVARRNRGAVVYESRTARSRRHIEAGHRRYDESLGK